MSYNILMIVNPKAGKAKISKVTPEIIRNLQKQNYKVITRYTGKDKNARNIVKDYYEPYDIVLVCGGDGTLNEVVQGLYERNKKVFIAFIPVGTTNDFARSLGVSFDKFHISKYINQYEECSIDMGKFNNHVFNYAATFGVFSQTSYNTPTELKNRFGRFSYIITGIKELFNHKSYKVKIATADRNIKGEFIYGSVTNSENIGGFKVFKRTDIEMDDGEFEVVLVKRPKNIFGLLLLALKMLCGFIEDKNVIFFKTSSIDFEFEKGTVWALDGERTERSKEISIINLKKYNSFIIPPEEIEELDEEDENEEDDDWNFDTYNIIYKD